MSTALHLAVRGNVDYNIARVLLENGADLESLNIRKQTPLHSFFSPLVLAVAQRHCSSLDILSTDARGMNLAHYFSWTNSSVPSDFQYLPSEASFLQSRDVEGRKPHHLAAQRGNKDVLDYLLTQTTGPHDTLADKSGNTLVHYAVFSTRAPDTIRLLLSRGLSLEAQNARGHTPLQHAACWGSVEALSFLLNIDPEGLIAQDNRGDNLLALARSVENKKVEMMLIARYGELMRNNGISLVSQYRHCQMRRRRSKENGDWIVFVSIISLFLALLTFGKPS